jgi:hypothetical protein
MKAIKSLNLGLAFLLELCMFISISYWGFQQGKTTFTSWVVAIACISAAIVLWAIFAAPNSKTRLPLYKRLIFELLMFLLSAFLLYQLNQPQLSLCMGLLSITSVTIAFIFKQ